ncbi:hypothetical protein AB3X82_23365 [Paraburkholderia phenoliruptrix]|uniref:Uncharacterized protein n=1 Tax=Paraburkholderia phenoliruptrix TaxID=252970 RepID=A0ABV3WJI5_9BURK
MQTKKMLYCPMMGKPEPSPDTAAAWREQHRRAWVFNPWTGRKRLSLAIEHDPDGWLLIPPDDTRTEESERRLLMELRASGALGQFRRFGWIGTLDVPQLIVRLRKGQQAFSFRLADPADEERYYELLHVEAWRFATQ